MKRLVFSGFLAAAITLGQSLVHRAESMASEFSYPWNSAKSSLVLDAYEYTPIDWTKIADNKRLRGFINKASDGLAPPSRCGGNVLCRAKWRRYAATKELYITRKVLAKTLGLRWGAYHLARPGNPVAQAEHFLSFTKPDEDDLLALDIEHNDPTKWMSLADAEIFAKHVKMRIGRYPFLYTNHTTSKFIAENREKYPLLSRLNLWYARYKPDINGVFPMGNWESYALWQFSSMVNCNDKTCLKRIKGAGNWIDVNVVAMSPEALDRQWPFAALWSDNYNPEPETPAGNDLIAEARDLLPAADSENDQQAIALVTKEVEETAAEAAITVASVPAVQGTAHLVLASVSTGHKPVTTRSVDPEEARRMWVRDAIKPKWRPGTVVRKRVYYRTSDLVIAMLARQSAKRNYHILEEAPGFVQEQVVWQEEPPVEAVRAPGAI